VSDNGANVTTTGNILRLTIIPKSFKKLFQITIKNPTTRKNPPRNPYYTGMNFQGINKKKTRNGKWAGWRGWTIPPTAWSSANPPPPVAPHDFRSPVFCGKPLPLSGLRKMPLPGTVRDTVRKQSRHYCATGQVSVRWEHGIFAGVFLDLMLAGSC
jgi:hypothetical protein